MDAWREQMKEGWVGELVDRRVNVYMDELINK